MTTTEQLFGEAYRLRLLRGVEESLAGAGFEQVAGVDEVGRGALAGPVTAAAVILDPTRLVPGVDDSKRLSPKRRERMAAAIHRNARAVAVVSVPPAEIDRINILQATRQAMLRALRALDPAPDCAVVDALPLPELGIPVLPLVRGDSFSYAVACASIVAKVARDRFMTGLDPRFPAYGFASNKGYGAAVHLQALARQGPCRHHRRSFRPQLPLLSVPATGQQSRRDLSAAGGA